MSRNKYQKKGVGWYIELEMQKQGLTTEKLAQMANLAEASVRSAKFHQGHKSEAVPTAKVLVKIANALGIRPVHLLELAYDPPDERADTKIRYTLPIGPLGEYIAFLVEQLPSESQHLALTLIATLSGYSTEEGLNLQEVLVRANRLRRDYLPWLESCLNSMEHIKLKREAIVSAFDSQSPMQVQLEAIHGPLVATFPQGTKNMTAAEIADALQFSEEQIKAMAAHPLVIASLGVLLPTPNIAAEDRLYSMLPLTFDMKIVEGELPAYKETWKFLREISSIG